MQKKAQTADEILAGMTRDSKTLRLVLDLLKREGAIPKTNRTKRQVIYKTKFVTRRPRTKRAAGEIPTTDEQTQTTL